MRTIILIMLIVFPTICSSQIIDLSNPCDGKIHVNSEYANSLNITNYSDFLHNYIDTINSGLIHFIEKSYSDLQQIRLIRCNDKEIIFSKKGEIECNIKIGTSFESHNSNYPLLFEVDNLNHYEDKLGTIESSCSYSYNFLRNIELRINGNIIKVEEKLYSDLINPNISYTESFVKPISLYRSETKKVYYLYIFGSTNYSYNGFERFINSYVRKIIFNENGVIGEITLPGRILNLFSWYECPDFIPF